MRFVYGVSSGDYSDYSVSCVFEAEEDAQSYARSRNGADARRTHDAVLKQVAGTPFEHDHTEPFETCEASRCKRFRDEPKEGEHRVEPFDFYATGKVPVAS